MWTELYWYWRAVLWGLFHPFATEEQHLRRAQWAAREQEKRNPPDDDGFETAWALRRCIEGWTCWRYHIPPRGVLIQVWRFEWPEPRMVTTEKFGNRLQEMNTCGMYWRLTGIGKESLYGALGSIRT
jgi:hypothetical protein